MSGEKFISRDAADVEQICAGIAAIGAAESMVMTTYEPSVLRLVGEDHALLEAINIHREAWRKILRIVRSLIEEGR